MLRARFLHQNKGRGKYLPDVGTRSRAAAGKTLSDAEQTYAVVRGPGQDSLWPVDYKESLAARLEPESVVADLQAGGMTG